MLRGKIDKSLKELEKNYRQKERDFLTEADAVSTLFNILKDRLKNANVAVHSQLRPFTQRNEVIVFDRRRKGWYWKKQRVANEGAPFDLAIIDAGDKYWKRAEKKAMYDQRAKKDLKYWRMLSYPIEAFLAAIEIKVRVWQNPPWIEKDINKLSAILKKNKKCLLYAVVLDRKANPKEVKKIEGLARRKKHVRVWLCTPRVQPSNTK